MIATFFNIHEDTTTGPPDECAYKSYRYKSTNVPYMLPRRFMAFWGSADAQ